MSEFIGHVKRSASLLIKRILSTSHPTLHASYPSSRKAHGCSNALMIAQRVFDPIAFPVTMIATSRARPGRTESLLSSMRSLKKGSTRLKMFMRDANETVEALSRSYKRTCCLIRPRTPHRRLCAARVRERRAELNGIGIRFPWVRDDV